MDSIRLEYPAEGVARLVVNRPQVRNALDFASQMRLGELLIQFTKDNKIVALILTGIGTSFLAGGDLRELSKYSEPEDGLRLTTVLGDALLQLTLSPIFVITAINGAARGGGAEIAVSSDRRIMADDADIAFVHAKLGLTPGWGGGGQLERIVGEQVADDLLATARVLNAREAVEIGLVDAVVGRDELESAALRVAVAVREGAIRPNMGGKLADSLALRRQALRERARFLRGWNSPERKQAFVQFAVK